MLQIAYPSLNSRDYNVLNGESDFNLPFQVDGNFSDEEPDHSDRLHPDNHSRGRNGGVGPLNAPALRRTGIPRLSGVRGSAP